MREADSLRKEFEHRAFMRAEAERRAEEERERQELKERAEEKKRRAIQLRDTEQIEAKAYELHKKEKDLK